MKETQTESTYEGLRSNYGVTQKLLMKSNEDALLQLCWECLIHLRNMKKSVTDGEFLLVHKLNVKMERLLCLVVVGF